MKTEMFTTLGLLALLLAAVWFWFQWKYRRIITALSKLPPITACWPILGTLHLHLQGHAMFSHKLFTLLQELGVSKGNNVAFWWGPFPYIVVGRGEDVEAVLTSKKCEKSFHYDFLKIFFGNGLLTAPDDIHKTTRRHCNPLFTPGNLERFASNFNSSSRSLVNVMSEHVSRGGPVQIQRILALKTSKTISDLLLGPGAYPNEATQLFQDMVPNFKRTANIVASRMAKPWLWPSTIFNFLYGKQLRSTLELWDLFLEDVYEKKEKKKVKDSLHSNKRTACDEENDPPTYLTLPEVYDAMQENYPQFTQKDMECDLLTLFVTGSHSMAVFVSSMFVALASHPHIQERLYQEVMSVVGPEDNDVTKEDLLRMPYLEQIVKETARRFFIVPLVIRKAKEDIQLCDMTLPAGTTMLISIITQHYDSEAFPDPHTFDPERFSTENMAKIKKHNFAPFGSGSRKCIGYYYVYYLAKLMAVHVMRRFRLTTSMDINNIKWNWDVAAISADGYSVEIHPRGPQTTL